MTKKCSNDILETILRSLMYPKIERKNEKNEKNEKKNEKKEEKQNCGKILL